jgi:hypothetical protein
MATLAAVEPQTSLEELLIEDSELEAQLEARERAKEKAGKARKTFQEVNDAVKVRVDELDGASGATLRCGRFLISRSERPGRNVSFETSPSTRLSIRVAKDDTLF